MPAARRFRLGLATCEAYASLTEEDRSIADVLRAREVDAEPVVWSAGVPAGLDGLIIRSCWDYHLAAEPFRGFVAERARLGPRLANPAETVLWNMHKGYLLDLEARGVDIAPTTLVTSAGDQRGASVDPDGPVVVKPAVSMNGWETHRFDAGRRAAVEATIARLSAGGDVLVQQYCPEIEQGEVSLIVLSGRFSHAVIKRPAAGEFRVQEEFGGTREAYAADPALVGEAERIVSLCPAPPLIARVDGVLSGERFVLMELEVIDPMLYVAWAVGATERAADAICAWMAC